MGSSTFQEFWGGKGMFLCFFYVFRKQACGQGARPKGRSKSSGGHHLPALIYGFFGGKENTKFLLPATTIENITRVNSLHKASNSLILMAINALVAICLIHLLPLAKF
jgi:hypothetical protein